MSSGLSFHVRSTRILSQERTKEMFTFSAVLEPKNYGSGLKGNKHSADRLKGQKRVVRGDF